MAAVPRAVLDYVTRQVNALSADAQARVLRVLESIEWTPGNVAECRELLVQALASVMPTYTDASAQAGADMYDAVRASQVGEALGATAASGYEPEATDGAVRAFVQDIVDGKPVEAFNAKVLDRVDRDIKRAANVSVAENAARDPLKPRYARVPTGAETCSFCLMLASRGFVYTSREAASHAHANCDCRVVPGFPGTEVEGYDPDAFLAEWRGRESFDIPEAKLTKYALDLTSERGKDKAIAFREALGFTQDDAGEIMRQVYRWVGEHDPVFRSDSPYGKSYTVDIPMIGKDGKTANVRTGWILEPGASKMRLTSIYVH